MSLKQLDILNVRNISKASLFPSSSINFIYGKNASGKSSILEAIYLLGRARSFRSTSIKKVIRLGSDELIVTGKAIQKHGNILNLGVLLDGKRTVMRINKEICKSRSDIAYSFPLQIIHPKSYLLLDAGPQLRREYIDWGIFNLREEYLPVWRRFKKALGQRNSLLRNQQINQISVWDQELSKYGTIVADYRKNYIDKLKPLFLNVVNHFLDFNTIDLKISSGWDDTFSFHQVLKEQIERDLKYGYTRYGPHYCDLQVLMNDKLVKDYVSRGQLKLLVIALKLAQIKLLHVNSSKMGCVLIDDLSSELDNANKAKLINFLLSMNVQIFITATEIDNFGHIDDLADYKMFHVEHGNITQV